MYNSIAIADNFLIMIWLEDKVTTPTIIDYGGTYSDEEILIKSVFELLEKVWKVYGKFNAWQLSSMSHDPEGPWKKLYKGSEIIIPNNDIRDYFKILAKDKKWNANEN